MKKAIVFAAVAAIAMLAGSAQTAKADHCSPYSRGYSSFGYSSYGYSPYNSYSGAYRYSPNYYGYSQLYAPSYGFSYARPGFSITFGRGYPTYGSPYRSYYGYSHHRHHHH
ncbi:hypothetical protein GC176_01915 [bacterium]|nr:hypothetical protein [bacterium]